jgi:hypothetical protein
MGHKNQDDFEPALRFVNRAFYACVNKTGGEIPSGKIFICQN